MDRVVVDSVSLPALSDALRDVTISGLFYSPSYLREPWGGTVPPMPGCVWFHAVTSGQCELEIQSERLVLAAGDLVLVPHGAGHVISAGAPASYPLIPEIPGDGVGVQYEELHDGGDGQLTVLVCGVLRLEHPNARRLLDGLPDVVRINAPRRSALATTLDLLAEEVRQRKVGNEAVVSRLCDILVIQAIRHHLETTGGEGSTWLRAMSDPQIGPALAALHAAPSEPWTVKSLASHAAMSRSAFAARFTELLDHPVIAYLTDVRMQLAVDLLHRSDRTIAEIAAAVGYESDASFCRVFKRHTGSSPRQVRSGRLAGDQVAR